MNDHGTFEIVGTVKYPPKGIGLKVETVEAGKGKTYMTTHEVLCFDKLLLNGLEVGDRIRITGHLGARKSEFLRDGKYPVYLTQLIARAIVPAEEGQAANQPRARHSTQSAESVRQQALPVDDGDVPF